MKKLFTKIVTFVLSFCLIGTAGLTVKADSDPNAHEHTGTHSFIEYLDENGNFVSSIYNVCDDCNEFYYVTSHSITAKEYYEELKESETSGSDMAITEEEFNEYYNYKEENGYASIDVFGQNIPIWTEEFFKTKTATFTVPENYSMRFLNGFPVDSVKDAIDKNGEPSKIEIKSDKTTLSLEVGYDYDKESAYQKLVIDGKEIEKAPTDFVWETLPSGTYTITVNETFIKTELISFGSMQMGVLTEDGNLSTHLSWKMDDTGTPSSEENKKEDVTGEDVTKEDSEKNTENNSESETTEDTSKAEEKSEITLSGILKDKDGNPIANAVIELHSDPITVKTDNNGYWEIKNPPVGDHTLTAYVAGKTVYQSEITVSKEKISETVKVKDETVAMSVKANVVSKVSSPQMGDSKSSGILIAVTMSCIVLATLGCYILISRKKKSPTK